MDQIPIAEIVHSLFEPIIFDMNEGDIVEAVVCRCQASTCWSTPDDVAAAVAVSVAVDGSAAPTAD